MAKLQTDPVQQTAPATEAMEEEWYDLLPVEKKLIKYSLGLGVALLIIFVIIFRILPNM